jgi:hypothetical protein
MMNPQGPVDPRLMAQILMQGQGGQGQGQMMPQAEAGPVPSPADVGVDMQGAMRGQAGSAIEEILRKRAMAQQAMDAMQGPQGPYSGMPQGIPMPGQR